MAPLPGGMKLRVSRSVSPSRSYYEMSSQPMEVAFVHTSWTPAGFAIHGMNATTATATAHHARGAAHNRAAPRAAQRRLRNGRA